MDWPKDSPRHWQPHSLLLTHSVPATGQEAVLATDETEQEDQREHCDRTDDEDPRRRVGDARRHLGRGRRPCRSGCRCSCAPARRARGRSGSRCPAAPAASRGTRATGGSRCTSGGLAFRRWRGGLCGGAGRARSRGRLCPFGPPPRSRRPRSADRPVAAPSGVSDAASGAPSGRRSSGGFTPGVRLGTSGAARAPVYRRHRRPVPVTPSRTAGTRYPASPAIIVTPPKTAMTGPGPTTSPRTDPSASAIVIEPKTRANRKPTTRPISSDGSVPGTASGSG